MKRFKTDITWEQRQREQQILAARYDTDKLREPDYLSPYPLCVCGHEAEAHRGLRGECWFSLNDANGAICACEGYDGGPPEPPDRRRERAEWEIAE